MEKQTNDLISVMLVDDERLALEDLRTLVDWESLGFRIVCTAVNGKQALARFKENPVQVVFTDIRMPAMDGIALVRELRALDRQVQILLLTAYADFSYAQQAIPYGITQYLIKSEIEPASLSKLLSELRGRIGTAITEHSESASRRIADFWHGHIPEAETEPEFQKPLLYLVIERDRPLPLLADMGNGQSDIPPMDRRYYRDLVAAVHLPDALTLREGSLIRPDRMLFTIEYKTPSVLLVHSAMQQLASDVLAVLKTIPDRSHTVFFCPEPASLVSFRKKLQADRGVLSVKYYSGCGRVYPMIPAKKDPLSAGRPVMFHSRFEENLLYENREALHAMTISYFNQLFEAQDREELLSLSRSLWGILRNQAEKLRLPAENILPSENDLLDFPRIRDHLLRLSDMIMDTRHTETAGAFSRPVLDAMRYVSEHFGEQELSVAEIAETAHLSAGYLGDLFRKETGISLKTHITDIRMKAAEQLLRENTLSVSEIAERCGYRSSQYFTTVFSGRTGKTPGEYRKEQNA